VPDESTGGEDQDHRGGRGPVGSLDIASYLDDRARKISILDQRLCGVITFYSSSTWPFAVVTPVIGY
jgi:hypothetical protein